jgi:tRNA-2-methylthio-N6-dimethylallyladenosine synthase
MKCGAWSQPVNHYEYKDGGKTTSFADLLARVHDHVPELPRLRFITSYPRDFTDDALDVMAASPRICRYLHIPAQSGSNRILRLMNRGYDVETYLGLLERARKRMPDICLAGDMIVGYPTETDEEHAMSVRLLEQAQYKSCFVFKYSTREGTVASRRLTDDIPEDVKKARNLELLQVQSDISLKLHQRHIGREIEVLVEGQNKLRAKPAMPGDLVKIGGNTTAPGMARLVGRTQGDEIVAFDGNPAWIGDIVRVRGLSATPLTVMAEAIAATAAA